MGRYYTTNNFDGKFGFAVQSSGDPEIFGMEEQEPSSIDYYLDGSEEAIKNCARVIDEQYDFLDIPESDRVYKIEKEQEVWDLYDKYNDKCFREYDEELDKEKIPFHSEKWKKGAVEVKDGVELAWCRISLGCKIYTDLVNDGYCSLNAEL